MPIPALSRLQQVPIREVWPTEPQGFTPWLASPENRPLLGAAIGLRLELQSTEEAVGDFRADIVCKTIPEGELVLIENQFGQTGHTHLGQILAYAAGLESVTGNAFVPKTQELFYHDADGNLANDGRWTYTWDAENRLVKMTPNTGVGPQISLKFEYDWQSRRIRQQVWNNSNWIGTPTNDVKFLYDGWNLLTELNATNNALLRSFVWGRDLSGTIQGAGGVGGLLFLRDAGSAIGDSAPAFDGNGTVMALVSLSGGTNCATYEYGPFGELLRATGPMAKANPFRFSSKYQDGETDLVYYGYRYEKDGRWLSRDPLAEAAFFKRFSDGNSEFHDDEVYYTATATAYVFVRNDPLSFVDYIGLLAGSAGTATIGDCTIAIYAGHGFLNSAFDDDGKLKSPKATDRLKYPHLLKGPPKCSGGAIIACNAAKFASIQNPIPSVSLNDDEISVLQGIGQIDGAVGSAQAFAKSVCENCACDKVTITVSCFPPFRKPSIFTSGSKWCGETITVPCPCKVKK